MSDNEDEYDDNLDYGDEENEGNEDEYDFTNDEQKFVSEMGAFDRAGGKKNLISFMGTSLEGETDFQRRRARFSMPDDDQFRYSLQMFINKISDDINVTDNDYDRLNELIDVIPNIKYKNPQAFFFAYNTIVAKEIDKTRLNKMEKLASRWSKDNEEDLSTTAPDIIRYCRLLMRYM
jgi:hypothetical protein